MSASPAVAYILWVYINGLFLLLIMWQSWLLPQIVEAL